MEKGGENPYKVLGKLYFRLDKILNKICEILEQILQTKINVNKQSYEAQYKRIKTDEITDNFVRKMIWVPKKI